MLPYSKFPIPFCFMEQKFVANVKRASGEWPRTIVAHLSNFMTWFALRKNIVMDSTSIAL